MQLLSEKYKSGSENLQAHFLIVGLTEGENHKGGKTMERRAVYEVRDEPEEPMIAQSKMGEARVSELEIKGIEDLTHVEKKHLLLQLARDRVQNPAAGPWEITNVIRDEWKTVKTTLTQPIEIDIKDTGRNALFRVSLDITKLERELETAQKE